MLTAIELPLLASVDGDFTVRPLTFHAFGPCPAAFHCDGCSNLTVGHGVERREVCVCQPTGDRGGAG